MGSRARIGGRALVSLAALLLLASVLVSLRAPWSEAAVVYRVNAGGPQISGSPAWTRDTKRSPSPYVNAAAIGSRTNSTTHAIDLSHASVPSGTPQSIFKKARIDIAATPNMQWDFPVSAGTLEVRLYFAEINSNLQAVGKRVFDVSIEGTKVLDDYDIFDDVGGYTGVVKSFTVESDANLDIDFAPFGSKKPSVNAIEVLDEGGGGGGAGTWETRRAMPVSRDEVTYVYVDGAFHQFGGGTTHHIYDPGSNSWSKGASLPVNLDHIQGAVVGGKVYLIGGLTSWPDGDVRTVYIYDPATDSISQGSPMPSGRGRGAGGVAVHQGKIYYAGGLHNGVAVSMFDVYDPATDRWTTLPNMPTARDHFHAAVLNGKFWAIGGRNVQPGQTIAANQAFTISSGTWQTGFEPLPTPRAGTATVVLGGEILVIGGEGGGRAWDDVEAYDPATDSWRTMRDMITARHGIQGAVCDGGVYVAGGATDQGGGHATSVHEVFFLGSSTSCGP